MTKHEISSWPNRADIRHTKEDGGTCLHSMSWDEFAEFYETAKAVRLTMIGMEEIQCRADELQEGDVFESLGSAVLGLDRLGSDVRVYLKDGKTLSLAGRKLVRVNRPIQ